jgi:hypothetical protein
MLRQGATTYRHFFSVAQSLLGLGLPSANGFLFLIPMRPPAASEWEKGLRDRVVPALKGLGYGKIPTRVAPK